MLENRPVPTEEPDTGASGRFGVLDAGASESERSELPDTGASDSERPELPDTGTSGRSESVDVLTPRCALVEIPLVVELFFAGFVLR